jgi:hypothetical protein
MMMMFVRMGGGTMGHHEKLRGGKGRRLDYHEETSSSRCNPVNTHLGNWRQDHQVVGWRLLKGRHSLCMMT